MKCLRCGKTIGLVRRGQMIMDGCVCYKCFEELGFTKEDRSVTSPVYYHWDEIRRGKAKMYELQRAKSQAHYEFLVRYDDEKIEAFLERYQKDSTDPEDRYDGMTLWEIKSSDDYKVKHYQYPPLDITVELRDAVLDGKSAIAVYMYDGRKDRLIGYAPKTKVRRIREIIAEKELIMSAELFGGHYRMLKDSGWVETDYTDPLKVRVRLDWSPWVKLDDLD